MDRIEILPDGNHLRDRLTIISKNKYVEFWANVDDCGQIFKISKKKLRQIL